MKTTRISTSLARTIRIVALLVLVIRPFCLGSEGLSPALSWLLDRHIMLQDLLLHDPGLKSDNRNELQREFHQFAFEYWLLSQTNHNCSSPWYRNRVRSVLHGVARNSAYFGDPARLLPYFRDDKLAKDLVPHDVGGLELDSLTRERYGAMVMRFQWTYYDPTNTFPVYPLLPRDSIVVDAAHNSALTKLLSDLKWPLLIREKLPGQYRKDVSAHEK